MMDSYITSGILEPLNQYTDEWDEWGNFTKEYVDMFTKDGKYTVFQIRLLDALWI